MAHSSLATVSVPAYSGNYTSGRKGSKIRCVTVHHMAGVLSAESCGNIFARVGRKGSSHYGIGNDGKIGVYVEEENAAWTNSNFSSNCESVTIETSNSSTGGDYPVSDAAYESLIKLVADIAKRNGLGTLVPGQNLTWHSMFTATTCVPASTEVLTKTGWKTIAEVEEGEDIATAHIDDLSIKFSPVLGKVPEKKQDTWEIRGVEATADHRMLWKTQCQEHYRISELKDIPNSSMVYIPNAGYYSGEGLPLSDNEIRLLVAVQADGHYEKGEKSGKDRITFHFAKERKISRLKELLAGYDYKVYEHADGTVNFNIKGLMPLANEWLDNKKLSWKMLEMSPSQAKIFLDELLEWDGCRAGNDYSSCEKQNIDIVDAVASLNGYGVRHNGDNRTAFTGDSRTITKESDKKRHQNTIVSCVTVESGVILTRQHGRTTIIGNCPGNYLRSRMQDIADRANAINNPTPTPVPTPTPEPVAGFAVGDKVSLKSYVDYNGVRLRKTRDYYFIKTLSGKRAVLSADSVNGVVYAAVNTDNLNKVDGGSPAPVVTPNTIVKGDKVVLKDWVDYKGTKLKKTRDCYFVSEINGDRAVLRADSVNGAVYAAVKVSNLKEV